MYRFGKTNLKNMDKTMQNARYIGPIKIDQKVYDPQKTRSEQQ